MDITSLSESKAYLVTFGSGSTWKPAVARLKSQCKKSKKFGKFISFSEKDLDLKLWRIDEAFIKENNRGYGLWIWKPFIIKKVFEIFPECELILYLDAGCELNNSPAAIKKLDSYINTAYNYGGLAFELPFIEKNWTAKCVIEKMDAVQFAETKQIAGGMFFLRNLPKNMKLLNLWGEIMREDNHANLLGICKAQDPNSNFKEHRYDQSIFSLLWKMSGLYKIKDESFWAPNWTLGLKYPIWSARSKLRLSFNTFYPILLAYRVLRKFIYLISNKKLVV